MGVDVDAVCLYGTTEDIREKLPKFLLKYYENEDSIIYEEQQEERLNKFMGFHLYENRYSGDFEGYGVDVNFKNPAELARVQAIFKKYKLGTPKHVTFTHWW